MFLCFMFMSISYSLNIIILYFQYVPTRTITTFKCLLAITLICLILAYYNSQDQPQATSLQSFRSSLSKVSSTPETLEFSRSPVTNNKKYLNSKVKYSYRVYTFINQSWIRNENMCEKMQNFPIVRLKTKYGKTPIAIHDPKFDIYVSRSIARQGVWEARLIRILMFFLEKNKESIFLDVGANIGVYSLSAAKLGRKVIAIDPLPTNIKRLCTSFAIGNFSKQSTIVTNPLSNEYVNVKLGNRRNNIGSTSVKNSKAVESLNETLSGELYPTAKLDDILSLPGFNAKYVVIKIDVEKHESLLLKGSNSFFDKTNVICVLMEWMFYRESPDGVEIIEFFTTRRYKPFAPGNYSNPLIDNQRSKWPDDIIWIK